MSIAWMNRVFGSNLEPIDRLIMLALADNASDEGLAWPSITTLARKGGVADRTVQRTLHRFVEAGWVLLEREPVGGRGRSNLYRLVDVPKGDKGDTSAEKGDFDGDLATERVTQLGTRTIIGSGDASGGESDSAVSAVTEHGREESPFIAAIFGGMAQAAFPGPATPHQAQEASAFEDEWRAKLGSVPPAAVGEYAVREAVDHGKRSWAYVRAVLRSAFDVGGIPNRKAFSNGANRANPQTDSGPLYGEPGWDNSRPIPRYGQPGWNYLKQRKPV